MFEIDNNQFVNIGDLVDLDILMHGDKRGMGVVLGRGQARAYDELTDPCIVCVFAINEAKHIDYYYKRLTKVDL